MAKTKWHKLNSALIFTLVIVCVSDFILILRYFLLGHNIALLNPKGMVANEQLSLLLFTTALLFALAIPTLLVLYFFAWRYREGNTKAQYKPSNKASTFTVASMWVVPTIFMFVLAFVMVPATHKLVPQKVIASNKEPLRIQVVSMNWKWLFLYPEENIATVNFVQIPIDRPVTFEMTADEAPMSSFWIPNLGGQLYAMTTHVNRLNLIAEVPGDYPGSSAEITGAGFSGMRFIARASTTDAYNDWVQEIKSQPHDLNKQAYDVLVKPSEREPVALYSSYDDTLYDTVLQKYWGSHGTSHGSGHGHESQEEPAH